MIQRSISIDRLRFNSQIISGTEEMKEPFDECMVEASKLHAQLVISSGSVCTKSRPYEEVRKSRHISELKFQSKLELPWVIATTPGEHSLHSHHRTLVGHFHCSLIGETYPPSVAALRRLGLLFFVAFRPSRCKRLKFSPRFVRGVIIIRAVVALSAALDPLAQSGFHRLA